MLKNTRKHIVAASFAMLAMLASALPVAAQNSHSSLQVVNGSGVTIYHLYLSSSGDNRWGRDQLGSSVLPSGSSFTLYGFSGGQYDIKLVDRYGTSCEVDDVAIYGDRSASITPAWLFDNCE